MSCRPTLEELLQHFATECGPLLRDEEMAAAAAAVIRMYFAVLPRTIPTPASKCCGTCQAIEQDRQVRASAQSRSKGREQ